MYMFIYIYINIYKYIYIYYLITQLKRSYVEITASIRVTNRNLIQIF